MAGGRYHGKTDFRDTKGENSWNKNTTCTQIRRCIKRGAIGCPESDSMPSFPVCKYRFLSASVYFFRQFPLLCFVSRGQLQKPLIADCTVYIVLINPFENPVKFRNPFFACPTSRRLRFISFSASSNRCQSGESTYLSLSIKFHISKLAIHTVMFYGIICFEVLLCR